MSKILITGNGFDLFHHLPTKYHHFIFIMKTIEVNNYEGEVPFDKLFGQVFKIKHPYEYNLIEENYNSHNIKFNHEKLNKIKQLLQTNLWYKHFSNVMEIDTWIDFEIEIDNVLNQLKLFNKYLDNRTIQKNEFNDPLIGFSNFEIFDIVEIYGDDGYFKINTKYINKRKSLIDQKKMIEDLLKSFEEFIMIFNRYLVDIVGVFYTEIKQKPLIPIQLMNEIYTFNFTPTLENIYNVDKSKVVYLHGEINNDCKKQNIVLGVNEVNDEVKKNKMYGFTKYYQKINKNSNPKFVQIPEKRSYNDIETIFYIIGHSLDESDKEYITTLFKFLNLDSSEKSKICVFYYDLHDKESKLRNLFSIIDKEIVVNMDKERRLYFVKLNEQNINEEFSRILYDKYGDYKM